MDPADVINRVLSPTVLFTVLATGVAYGALLWSLDLRPLARLVTGAMLPGGMFLAIIWAIRGLQGTLSILYLLLIVDWLVFSAVGVVTVLAARRWKHRRR